MEININKKPKSKSKKKVKAKKSKRKGKDFFKENDKVPKRPIKWLSSKKRPPQIRFKIADKELPDGKRFPKPLDWL
jgi:hypothetical protein